MFPMENFHLYNAHEISKAGMAPVRIMAEMGKHAHLSPYSPLSYTSYGRSMGAAFTLLSRMTRSYAKPDFSIYHTDVDGKTVEVSEEVVAETPFCNLLHFRKRVRDRGPKLLIVAPMSGHHATLLRGTVKEMVREHDVYITDWIDAREIPLLHGPFTLDDYIDHVIDFTRKLGPDVHLMAVCQPAVPVLAAASIMAAQKDPKCPASMTLIGGPIDTRINPTKVNELAETKSLEWFKQHVITRVPFNYPGFMRRVYPGFIQLTGFMQMNLDRHIGEHMKLFQHLVEGDGDSAQAHREFYNEYLSVMDLPAEFYLQSIHTVFQEHSLPKGTMVSRDRPVKPDLIKRTALLTIEGEKDDISGLGQTKAAHKLCKGLAEGRKKHYVQKSVGHYGLFNGRRFREHIVPVIAGWIGKHNK